MLLSPHDFEAQSAWGFGGHHHSPSHRRWGLTTLYGMSHGCPIQKNSSKTHPGAGYLAKGLKQGFKTNQELESLQANELHGSCPGKGSGVAIKSLLAQPSMVAAGWEAQEQACSLTVQKRGSSRQMGSCSQRGRQQEPKSSSGRETKCCSPQQGTAARIKDSPSLGVRGRGCSHTTSRGAFNVHRSRERTQLSTLQ